MFLAAIRDRIRADGAAPLKFTHSDAHTSNRSNRLLFFCFQGVTRCAVDAKRSPRPWKQPATRPATAAPAAAAGHAPFTLSPSSPRRGQASAADPMSDAQLLRDCGLQHLT